MTDETKKPRKSRKKKNHLAEVISIKEADDHLVETLEWLLQEALEGSLTGFTAHILIDHTDQVVICGASSDRPLEAVGVLDLMKGMLLDSYKDALADAYEDQ
jgi:hypothetical protein